MISCCFLYSGNTHSVLLGSSHAQKGTSPSRRVYSLSVSRLIRKSIDSIFQFAVHRHLDWTIVNSMHFLRRCSMQILETQFSNLVFRKKGHVTQKRIFQRGKKGGLEIGYSCWMGNIVCENANDPEAMESGWQLFGFCLVSFNIWWEPKKCSLLLKGEEDHLSCFQNEVLQSHVFGTLFPATSLFYCLIIMHSLFKSFLSSLAA